MSEKENEHAAPDVRHADPYANIETRIIADMLQIEHLTYEVREFKTETRKSLDKLEKWIIGIVCISISTLLAATGALTMHIIGV